MTKKALHVAVLILVLVTFGCGRREAALRAPGTVEGEIITVRTLTAGTLASWAAEEGETVEKGELLGEMDMAKVLNGLQEVEIAGRELANQEVRLRKKIDTVKETVGYWAKQVERFERLTTDKAIAGEQLEKARLQRLEAETTLFDLQKSLAGLDIQREKLANKRGSLELAQKDMRLVSPVRGLVLETFVSQGETLLPGAALADILALGSLYVEVFLEEEEISRLKLGDRVTLSVDGLPGRAMAGSISFFGRKAEFSPKYILSEKERKALLYEVKVAIDQDQDLFKVGTPVTVTFGTR